jgi:hypothetical protein
MFVEMLVVVPLLALLWTIVVFLEQGNSYDHEIVQDSRYCAWRHAVDEGKGGPSRGCRLTKTHELLFAELDGSSGGALTTLAKETPFIAYHWLRPHGKVFTARKRGVLARPLGWSKIRVETHHTWMAQTSKGKWRSAFVMLALCMTEGLDYCSVGPGMGMVMDIVGDLPSASVDIPANALDAERRFRAWQAERMGGP